MIPVSALNANAKKRIQSRLVLERLSLCQRLLKDEVQNRRFATHEMLLQYDSISNLIRRGEFKKLDQELETGSKRGMCSFEGCLADRMAEGYRPTFKESMVMAKEPPEQQI